MLKNSAWLEITTEVNKINGILERKSSECKKKYQDIRSSARKKLSEDATHFRLGLAYVYPLDLRARVKGIHVCKVRAVYTISITTPKMLTFKFNQIQMYNYI